MSKPGHRLLLLLVVAAAEVSLAGRDAYGILGVSKGATPKEIKKAYRKLAIQYHPDKNPGNQAASDKFTDLGWAYETVSDPEKRKVYDRGGEEAVQKQGSGGGEDVFSSMFGGMFGGGRNREPDTPRGDTLTMDLDVTLEQLYNGDFIEFLRAKPVPKETPGTRECNCKNQMRTVQAGPGRFQMVQERKCEQCPNVKLEMEYLELDVEIEVGMEEGQELTFPGEGEPHIDGENGDLKLRINQLPHPRFWRTGKDLHCNVTVSLRDALLGVVADVEHLDGHKVHFDWRQIVSHHNAIKVHGEGMKSYTNENEKGDLYVTFDVEMPKTHLGPEAREALLKALDGHGGTPVAYRGI